MFITIKVQVCCLISDCRYGGLNPGPTSLKVNDCTIKDCLNILHF